ncbi:MAG: glycosyltransferase [Candidatus Caenarcaniphilales bacterium]|nr:glycosyltransferase [Candidatus Caenarcaniphilales bacterium]
MLNKLKHFPRELVHDRFILLLAIILLWAFIRLLEHILPERFLEILPGPLALVLLFPAVAGMTIYSCVVCFAQRKSGHPTNRTFTETPQFDIFIPAHNEQSVILETLENMLLIDYPHFKIWVIDDRSSDFTPQIVADLIQERGLEDKIKLVRRFDVQVPGKPASLNQLLRMTDSPYILVCDADAKLQSDCLRLALPYFLEDPRVGALQFQKQISNANFNTLTLCQDLEFAFDTYLQKGRDTIGGFVELRGNGQITTRKALEDVGGWDESALTEDLELSARLHISGWKMRFAPEIKVQEEGVLSAHALLKQRRRWAEGSLRRYLKHWRSFFSPQCALTLNHRLDILAFLTQFAIPIWVFLDIIVQLVAFLREEPTHISVLMLATFLIGLNMCLNIIIGIQSWRPYRGLEAVRLGILAFFYGAAHWPAIVLWTTRKVIFGRRPTPWTKTPRMAELASNQLPVGKA